MMFGLAVEIKDDGSFEEVDLATWEDRQRPDFVEISWADENGFIKYWDPTSRAHINDG